MIFPEAAVKTLAWAVLTGTRPVLTTAKSRNSCRTRWSRRRLRRTGGNTGHPFGSVGRGGIDEHAVKLSRGEVGDGGADRVADAAPSECRTKG